MGTELLPGIAMSNEAIENNVMKRPPRTKEKKLVSNALLVYGYGYEGQIQSLICVLAYLFVFWLVSRNLFKNTSLGNMA